MKCWPSWRFSFYINYKPLSTVSAAVITCVHAFHQNAFAAAEADLLVSVVSAHLATCLPQVFGRLLAAETSNIEDLRPSVCLFIRFEAGEYNHDPPLYVYSLCINKRHRCDLSS